MLENTLSAGGPCMELSVVRCAVARSPCTRDVARGPVVEVVVESRLRERSCRWLDLLSRLDLFCWSDCNLGSVKSECTIPGFLLLFRLGRDDSTVFFSGWNRLIGRDVGGQRWSSLIGPPELLHSHLKCTCSGAAKMTAWCARRKSHPRRGRGRAVTRKRCRWSLSSMPTIQ